MKIHRGRKSTLVQSSSQRITQSSTLTKPRSWLLILGKAIKRHPLLSVELRWSWLTVIGSSHLQPAQESSEITVCRGAIESILTDKTDEVCSGWLKLPRTSLVLIIVDCAEPKGYNTGSEIYKQKDKNQILIHKMKLIFSNICFFLMWKCGLSVLLLQSFKKDSDETVWPNDVKKKNVKWHGLIRVMFYFISSRLFDAFVMSLFSVSFTKTSQISVISCVTVL